MVLAASRDFSAAWSPCPGLPRVLVDVRHEAAHNELPTLALLQAAARAALAWLAAGYWQRQADHLAAWRGRTAELLQVRQLPVTRGWSSRTGRLCCVSHLPRRKRPASPDAADVLPVSPGLRGAAAAARAPEQPVHSASTRTAQALLLNPVPAVAAGVRAAAARGSPEGFLRGWPAGRRVRR